MAAILVFFSFGFNMSSATDDSLTFFFWLAGQSGHAEWATENLVTLWNMMTSQRTSQCLSSVTKWPLLCVASLLTYLYQNSSSELHGGGTGRVQSMGSQHTAPLLAAFPPSNMSTNSNSRSCLGPAHVWPLKAEGDMHFRVWKLKLYHWAKVILSL